MIEVEGYKAFNGKMRIIPAKKSIKPFEIECDWIYKPEYDCWYGNGASYPADICVVVSDNNS